MMDEESERPRGAEDYFLELNDSGLISEAAAGPAAFDPKVWYAIQAEITRRGLNRIAKKVRRRTAAARERNARAFAISLGFGIASPLAVASAAWTFWYLINHGARLGPALRWTGAVAVIVLFSVGVPIDLLQDRWRRKRTAGLAVVQPSTDDDG